jgi:hypothetical protein
MTTFYTHAEAAMRHVDDAKAAHRKRDRQMTIVHMRAAIVALKLALREVPAREGEPQ